MGRVLSLPRLLIIVVWLGLVGSLWLGGGDAPQEAEPLVPDAAHVVEAEGDGEWHGVYMRGKKIGYTHHRFEALEDGGYRFEQRSFLKLKVLDRVQNVRVSITGETGPRYALRRFTARLKSGVGDLASRGEVVGNELRVWMGAGDEETEQRYTLEEPIYLPVGVRRSLAGQLEEGAERTVRVFDPATMQHQPMTVAVEGRETLGEGENAVEAWRVREQFRGMTTTVWYDDDGDVLHERGPMDMTTVRENAAHAVGEGWGDGEAFDLMGAVAIPVREPLRDARSLRRLKVELGGIPGVELPIDARQRLVDGHWIVEREAVPSPVTYELPYRGEEWADALAATPFLQSDHPRIRASAQRAVGDTTNPRRAAEKLRTWVFQRLRKAPTASIPNALQALKMGEGDCNEHSVLFAALARAAGLPARVVAGAVYIDGVFLYHAWNEVWLGSGWVSVDATMDQMPVDATHIKVVEGGPESHDRILSVIGRLSIEVLEAEAG